MIIRVFAVAVAALGWLWAGPSAAAKPNIVLVMTDDQAVRDMAAMPQTLKLLRDQGVAFSNSFSTWPLCCPSRATLFTGQYAHNHKVLGNFAPAGGARSFADAESLPVWLQRAGYRTTHIGKYLNGYGADSRGSTYIPPGWSDWKGMIDPTSYRMWGYTINDNGVLRTYGNVDVEDPALYQTDVLRKLAIAAINEGAASGKPFFVSLAPLAPHEEVSEAWNGTKFPGPRPAPRHVGTFGSVALPRPGSFDEADLSDKPAFVAAFAAVFGGETITQRTSRYRRRLESLRAVDDAVSGLVTRLNTLGLLQNTYVVFTSDNGWFNGEHRVNLNKFLMYEPSIRVPLFIRGPGLAPGTSPELVANIDLAPTFAEIAGVAPGRVVDGRSLLPYARDKSLRSSRPILLESPVTQPIVASGGSLTLPTMRGLRTTRYVYLEHGTGELELYDLQVDPNQLKSAHKDPLYGAVRASLREMLARYAACTGTGCR